MWTVTDLVRRLGIVCPIVQGPLGNGLSPPVLAAAVSQAGGLGSIGANAMTPAEIVEAAAETRRRTAKPFAVNLWAIADDGPAPAEATRALARLARYHRALGIDPPAPPDRFLRDLSAQADAVLAARPAAFSFVFGIPSEATLRECRRLGILTIGTATTVGEAVALERSGVDAVVATGAEAGGMRPTFLVPDDDPPIGTLALVPQVATAVGIPVIAAGGIADARGVAAALALGAQAVQLGTAFLACGESGAPRAHRAALLDGAARGTVLTRAFNGRMARVIPNRLVDDLAADGDGVAPFPVQAWATGSLRRAAVEQGRTDLLAMQASQSASLLRRTDAAALVKDLVQGTTEVLARLSP